MLQPCDEEVGLAWSRDRQSAQGTRLVDEYKILTTTERIKVWHILLSLHHGEINWWKVDSGVIAVITLSLTAFSSHLRFFCKRHALG